MEKKEDRMLGRWLEIALCFCCVILIAIAFTSCKAKQLAKIDQHARVQVMYKADSTRYVQWRDRKTAIDSMRVVVFETVWVEGDSLKKRTETNQASLMIEDSQGQKVDSTSVKSQEKISIDKEKKVEAPPPAKARSRRRLWMLLGAGLTISILFLWRWGKRRFRILKL